MNGTKKTWIVGLVAGAVLLAAASAGATPRDRNRTLGPDETARLRERVAGKIERVRRRVEALGEQGRIPARVMERFRSLHTKVVERTERIFSDGRVTPEERQELRGIKRHVRRFKRSVVQHLGIEVRGDGGSGDRHRRRHGGRNRDRDDDRGQPLPPPDDPSWGELP